MRRQIGTMKSKKDINKKIKIKGCSGRTNKLFDTDARKIRPFYSLTQKVQQPPPTVQTTPSTHLVKDIYRPGTSGNLRSLSSSMLVAKVKWEEPVTIATPVP